MRFSSPDVLFGVKFGPKKFNILVGGLWWEHLAWGSASLENPMIFCLADLLGEEEVVVGEVA